MPLEYTQMIITLLPPIAPPGHLMIQSINELLPKLQGGRPKFLPPCQGTTEKGYM